MAGGASFQDATEHRLVKAKLLLDCLRGQTNLPTHVVLAAGDPAVDKGELDAMGIIYRKAVAIGMREELPALAGRPEVLNRSCKIDGHHQISAWVVRSKIEIERRSIFLPSNRDARASDFYSSA